MSSKLISHLAATALQYPALRQNLLVFGMTIISLLAAPEGVTGWRITLAGSASLLVCVTLASWQAAIETSIEQDRFVLRMSGLITGALAIFLSMFGTILSGFMLLPILFALTRLLSLERPFVAVSVSAITIPMWVWMLLDSWRWELLALLPLGLLAMLAVSHLMDCYDRPEDTAQVLPPRAHRAAAWMSLALAGVLLILLGLLWDVNKPWLALAGLILAAGAPLEAGLVSTDDPLIRSLRIVSAAFMLASVCWLIAIP